MWTQKEEENLLEFKDGCDNFRVKKKHFRSIGVHKAVDDTMTLQVLIALL